MLARQLVLLTSSESFHPTQLLSRQRSTPLSALAATLMGFPVSVANKRLTAGLNPLAATLTKNRGVGGVMVNRLPADFKIPTCNSHSETQGPPPHHDHLRSFFSFIYKLPILYPLCFDIHASDGGCTPPNFSTFQRSNMGCATILPTPSAVSRFSPFDFQLPHQSLSHQSRV